MATSTVYTLEQLATHKTEEDCWFAVHGKVYDVTKFLEDHPGGIDSLTAVAGTDATEEFEAVAHSQPAIDSMGKWQVGVLEESAVKVSKKTVNPRSASTPAEPGSFGLVLKVGLAVAVIAAYYFATRK
eukprot:EG_transcript_40410